jgi:predicted nucleic acid-binding protein
LKIFLDTTPLWMLVHPAGGDRALALRRKLAQRLRAGDEVAIAEVCDYEARRELLRKGATRQLQNLDELLKQSVYLPIDTDLMRAAAALWAGVRGRGKPTASDAGLDGDVILAAQALRFEDHLVITNNVQHLSDLCNALEMYQFSNG